MGGVTSLSKRMNTAVYLSDKQLEGISQSKTSKTSGTLQMIIMSVMRFISSWCLVNRMTVFFLHHPHCFPQYDTSVINGSFLQGCSPAMEGQLGAWPWKWLSNKISATYCDIFLWEVMAGREIECSVCLTIPDWLGLKHRSSFYLFPSQEEVTIPTQKQ